MIFKNYFINKTYKSKITKKYIKYLLNLVNNNTLYVLKK